MNLQQVLLILRSRWLLVVAIFVTIVAPVAVLNLVLPKLYTATASVVVDLRPDPVAGQANPAQVLPQYMATQLDIVGSPRVARRVVEIMKLTEDPAFQREWRQGAQGRGTLEDFVAGRLKRKLTVAPAGESNVIDISMTWPNAVQAAVLANAFAKAYVDTTIELTVEPARQYAGSFGQRAEELRADLQAKQKLLSDFESENGLVVTDDRLDVEQSRLAELSTQLVAVQGQRQESQSRQTQAAASQESTVEVLSSPVIVSLKADLARDEARLQDMGTRLGTSHPEYLSTEAEVDSLRSRIAQERARVIASLGDSTRINRARERDLATAIEAQKQRIIELKHKHDQAQILQNDVATAQRNLDAVTQRQAQSSLEGQTQQTNLAVLTAAVEPIESSSPKILLNIMLAVLLGLGLGVGSALLYERADRRVRVDTDLIEILGVPVFGRMPAVTPQAARLRPAVRALPRLETSTR